MHRAAILLLLAAAALAASEEAGAATDPAPAADDPNAGTWLADLTDWLPDLGTIMATRGERNNNPGNIRLSATRWQGQIDGTDKSFVTFATPQDGIRAMAKLLRNYQVIYGLDTVRGIVSRWAPPTENNTAAYIAAVAAQMGVGADQSLDLSNDATLDALVTAVIRHENGRVSYAAADIAAGVAAA